MTKFRKELRKNVRRQRRQQEVAGRRRLHGHECSTAIGGSTNLSQSPYAEIARAISQYAPQRWEQLQLSWRIRTRNASLGEPRRGRGRGDAERRTLGVHFLGCM